MFTTFLKRLLPLQILLILTVQGVTFLLPASAAAASYSNASIADMALEHVGENYGDCWTFVRDMIYQASGRTQDIGAAAGGGDYFAHLANTGGVQITDPSALSKGDVVQEGHYGGHIFIIVSRLSDSTFDVVDANHDWTGTVMHYHRSVMLDSDDHAYSFGSTSVSAAAIPTWSGVNRMSYFGTDHLANGQQLVKGQFIESFNAQYALAFQSDGNLVLYGGGIALWNSNTDGTDASRLVMQGDGNLVMYNPQGIALWYTKTDGQGASMLTVQNEGNFTLNRTSDYWNTYNSNTGGHAAHSYTGSNLLTDGQTLAADQYLKSADNRYGLMLQSDGNLILYGPGFHAIWDSHTSGSGANRLVMQGDGNLVLYKDGTAKWNSRTVGNGVSSVNLQSDGNLVLRRAADNTATWASGTNGRI